MWRYHTEYKNPNPIQYNQYLGKDQNVLMYVLKCIQTNTKCLKNSPPVKETEGYFLILDTFHIFWLFPHFSPCNTWHVSIDDLIQLQLGKIDYF